MAAIAYNPTDMHSKVFLTRPDKHGEVKRARVVEILKDFDHKLESNKERQRFIKDLKYRVVYDCPSQRNKKRTDDPTKLQQSSGSSNDDDSIEDSAFEDILSYNDICEYLTREISEEEGE